MTIHPFLIDPAVRATAKPAAAEVALSAAGGEVRASTYAPDYVPPRGWIVAAADEPQLEGARLLIADRLGFDPAGRQAWLALPSDPREWKQADTYGRVEIIMEWIVSECNAIMRAELMP